jgi:hypothetical protein
VLYLILLAILVTTSKSCTFNFCSNDFGINHNIFMTIITLCIQFFRQKSCIITYTIFSQCMVLHRHRKSIDWLTSVPLVQLRVVFDFLRSILLLLALQGCYSSFVVVFNHMTMMPCRNLRPHVRCSHMIEPLGAHWWLGICDVTPLQSLLMQPY